MPLARPGSPQLLPRRPPQHSSWQPPPTSCPPCAAAAMWTTTTPNWWWGVLWSTRERSCCAGEPRAREQLGPFGLLRKCVEKHKEKTLRKDSVCDAAKRRITVRKCVWVPPVEMCMVPSPSNGGELAFHRSSQLGSLSHVRQRRWLSGASGLVAPVAVRDIVLPTAFTHSHRPRPDFSSDPQPRAHL